MRHDRNVRAGGTTPGDDRGSDGEARAHVGSMLEVRRTLHRVALATAEARARHERSLALLDRARVLLDDSSRIIQGASVARTEAKAAVTALVVRLRTEGLPPQRVLIVLKDAARDAAPPELELIDQRSLVEDVVRWSIAAYYAA